MKTINRTKAILLMPVFVLATGFISCKKSQAGPAGPQGAAGTNGNANVKSFVFAADNWKADTACRSYCFKYHNAGLTSSVLESGLVMLYLGDKQGDNENQWRPMPVSGTDIHFTFNIELSTVQIEASRPDGKMPSNPGARKFRLVIIPPAS